MGLLFAALLCLAAVAGLPEARAHRLNFSSTSTLPNTADRALSGGVLTLRAPEAEQILITKSTFTMGSSAQDVQRAMDACRKQPLGERCTIDMFDHERNEHRVILSSYWLDRTEVTVQAYRRCVQARRCREPAYSSGAKRFDKPMFPVTLVTWQDARDYCAFVGKHLPTEAQWERAARGVAGRRYPWGDHDASMRANHGAFSIMRTDASDGTAELAPVGSYPYGRTPDGFEHLAGNVAEWVLDSYQDGYENRDMVDPKGPPTNAYRVIRGGSYVFAMPWLRGAARMFREASTTEPYIGFRCAKNAKLP